MPWKKCVKENAIQSFGILKEWNWRCYLNLRNSFDPTNNKASSRAYFTLQIYISWIISLIPLKGLKMVYRSSKAEEYLYRSAVSSIWNPFQKRDDDGFLEWTMGVLITFFLKIRNLHIFALFNINGRLIC